MPKQKIEYADLERNTDGKVVIRLETPIKLKSGNGNETVIDELALREPKIKDLKLFDSAKGNTEAMIKLLGQLAQLEVTVVEHVSVRDLNLRINPVMEALMGESPETGETSSES
mgnify:CR=1 FL=1